MCSSLFLPHFSNALQLSIFVAARVVDLALLALQLELHLLARRVLLVLAPLHPQHLLLLHRQHPRLRALKVAA